MHPEPRRTSFAPADSSPRGPMCTGPPRGPIQTAGPRFFCFLLPRVHAADVAAAPPPPSSSSSTSPASAPAPPPSTLPNNFSKPEFPDTGWERIKDLFSAAEGQSYPEELTNIVKLGILSAVTGFVYGGLPAARISRQQYIQVSQAEMYTGRVDAVRSAHNAALRGFVRYGWRWSWRVTLIATLFNCISTGLSVYRDKDAVSHYVAGGAITLGLYRFNLGPRGLVAGGTIGAVLGLPLGALVIGLQRLTGETYREKRRRERREIYELRLQEWAARLEVTDEFISSLNVSAQAEETRIQELLSLPQNKGVEQDSSS
ncbi:complex I assembly factor TIMMDC1, mitochondrial [Kryptolebias marmoratus]|uniref:Complex I assembly factor TIMMDC1, mitochondrial n=1 Tax=Kryptolebias marmoratus TaxID=37003 RepID=A0A3Q3A727_KRYMA|nr:complex I assembly factor TIMMDC1, mitochondrial [Kryptolebias marmoratus]XP_017288278.1 complex I assembly factor TIMMDC1, mitochondrial [Kryptolebias marmoratus]